MIEDEHPVIECLKAAGFSVLAAFGSFWPISRVTRHAGLVSMTIGLLLFGAWLFAPMVPNDDEDDDGDQDPWT